MSHFQQWSKASAAERLTIVQAELRRKEEDQRKERNRTWKTADLDEVGSTRAKAYMDRTTDEGPV